MSVECQTKSLNNLCFCFTTLPIFLAITSLSIVRHTAPSWWNLLWKWYSGSCSGRNLAQISSYWKRVISDRNKIGSGKSKQILSLSIKTTVNQNNGNWTMPKQFPTLLPTFAEFPTRFCSQRVGNQNRHKGEWESTRWDFRLYLWCMSL